MYKSVKCRDVGWGNQLDGEVIGADVATSVSTLYTHTINWRTNLYEGCLIEIKCKDDFFLIDYQTIPGWRLQR